MASTKILQKKKEVVKELKEKIEKASVLILSNYTGFTVKEITELRKKLYQEESDYNVVKNTLLSRAVEEAGYPNLKEFLSGPTALLLGRKDPITPLKALVEFIKENEKGEVRAGVVEKTFVEKEKILEMAKLPSREVLIAKVVGGFKSPICGLVNVLQGTLRSLVYALNAIKDKKGGEKK